MDAIYTLFRPRRCHKPIKHSAISRDDSENDTENDTTKLLPSPSLLEKKYLTQSQHDIRIAVKTLLLSTLVYASIGIWLIWSMHGMRHRDTISDLDEVCMDRISRYSPVVKDVSPGWHDVQFNGTFLHENEFRGPAGEETDRAWDSLGVNYRSVVVPEEDAEASGVRHDQVKISQFYGGGFPANVEGLHHLHCLDLLRKTLHWNYDHYKAEGKGAFTNSEYIVRVHATHCLDILRQVLMCTPDVGVLGQVWWQPPDEPHPMAFVDFMTTHRCRNFEAVRAWAEKHQLPAEKDVDMSRFYEMPGPEDMIYPEIP